jgi:hypothetical protein
MNDLNKNGNWFDNAKKLGTVANIFEGETLANFEVCQEDESFMKIIDWQYALVFNRTSNQLIDYANGELI